MRELTGILLLVAWIAGIVIAKGFWSTLIAITFPLWSWYLVLERLMYAYGILG
jgi:hypothetical protein